MIAALIPAKAKGANGEKPGTDELDGRHISLHESRFSILHLNVYQTEHWQVGAGELFHCSMLVQSRIAKIILDIFSLKKEAAQNVSKKADVRIALSGQRSTGPALDVNPDVKTISAAQTDPVHPICRPWSKDLSMFCIDFETWGMSQQSQHKI